MPRVCTICSSHARSEIEKRLLEGTPIRQIALRHGISEASLHRHKSAHLEPKLARALERSDEIDADRLVRWVAGLNGKTIALLQRAEDVGDLAAARGLIAEARKNLELLARLTGILEPNAAIHVDMRRQVAVLQNLSEAELRALARGDDVVGGVVAGADGA